MEFDLGKNDLDVHVQTYSMMSLYVSYQQMLQIHVGA
jgi:hypothetical protein